MTEKLVPFGFNLLYKMFDSCIIFFQKVGRPTRLRRNILIELIIYKLEPSF